MQKIYVLLRNDKQTGPYSLEEIIQFDLKPYDLIWIEGKSAGWYYPQEIGALHPYLSFVPEPVAPAVEKKATVKQVFVSMPASTVLKEQPAMHLPETTAAVVPAETYKQFEPVSRNIEEAVYAQFKEPVEEKPTMQTNTVTAAKPKRKSTVSVGGAIAAVLIVGGVFAASWMMNRHPAEEAANAAYNNPSNETEIADSAVAKNDDTKNTQPVSVSKQKTQKNNLAPKRKTVVVKGGAPQQAESKVTADNASKETTDYNITAPAKEDEQVATKEAPTAPEETTTAPQEKKKKLRDKILDIFKKKPNEEKTEEAKPAETENGERKATRREDAATLAQQVNVRFDVPNAWMMGIKNAKATLVNHSNEKITKAVVEVSYYDDDNQLLQKKTITFSKVGAKDSQTISIPDHSTATKVDYSIVSVSGDPAA